MKFIARTLTVFLLVILAISCGQDSRSPYMNIIFLHHSTGQSIWDGGGKSLKQLFRDFNNEYDTNYAIREQYFPKNAPYGWNNYPYDYYNIWVKNAGEEPYMKEPTLEMLTKDYQVIMFKHCFPVSDIKADLESPDINSDVKTMANYKLQYLALRDKMHEFPNTKFIVWTGAVLLESRVSEENAMRAMEFFKWVMDEWDLPEDNIYLWDLYSLQTEGGLYLKNEYAKSEIDSHPNEEFAGKAVTLLFNRVVDVIDNNGKGTLVTGEKI
jgi:glutaredoxin-related protein